MTNGFALNHDKNLQIYFFCVKRQAKNDFLKDVESTVTLSHSTWIPDKENLQVCLYHHQKDCHLLQQQAVPSDTEYNVPRSNSQTEMESEIFL